ncbi:putative 33.9 kDa protein in glnA 5'region [Gracilariopsis chorda]|uniref:Putative 33.9 kDa protein in glnA 5'region n=1 Tax=Gracilariopsis chorda TaxID=448386 RepID=A0A2V3ICM6_9FLOR|nr:putative 33.9 kDa protein in glnA 5'region [Gracilariopsis chorda]|eukprot:PXF39845.1 putative 33.9 kDa protein in glnA 5'region [Gracilariopsis chorda]
MAPSGGYVVGRQELVEKAGFRLAAPGIRAAAGLGSTKALAQGLFMAPSTVGEALKGGLLVAETMAYLGYDTIPPCGERGYVRAVRLGCEHKVRSFCEAVQQAGPVGAFVRATMGESDGYADRVLFAQSTFVDGCTAELSADAPAREPWAVFAQGGLCWQHWALALARIVSGVGWASDSHLSAD